ncbi:acyltransferase [bacterium]|nr:MAG: acyltransferase [bacterium]
MCYAKRLAKTCGENVLIGVGCEIRNWDKLELGSNISIQRGCWVDACGGLKIGDNISIATQCVMVSFDHQWSDETLAIRDNKAVFAPIVLEGDIWLGAGAKIMKGVTIGRRSIVAAGAVVNKDVPPRSIVGGIPAKVLKTI